VTTAEAPARPCFGCAGKLARTRLKAVMDRLPPAFDPRLIAGSGTFDDASVLRLSDELGLVSTVDVMDPFGRVDYRFGRAAAANALSDVYAMGGEPIVVVNVVCTPSTAQDMEGLYDVLRGAQEVVLEAGAALGGGHTTVSERFKFGLAVTGKVHPARVVRNDGARPGDALVLSKPLGAMALLNHYLPTAPDHEAVGRAFAVMERLNREAARVMVNCGAHACTDVTGFGFLGHLSQLMEASGTTARISVRALPVLAGALGCAEAACDSAGAANRESFSDGVRVSAGVAEAWVKLAYEPVTSGGLLIAIPETRLDALLEALPEAAFVGEVLPVQAGTRLVLAP